MAAPALLFDVEPFTDPLPPQRQNQRIRADVRAALARLKRTIDEIPQEEWDKRRQRWEELVATIKSAH